MVKSTLIIFLTSCGLVRMCFWLFWWESRLFSNNWVFTKTTSNIKSSNSCQKSNYQPSLLVYNLQLQISACSFFFVGSSWIEKQNIKMKFSYNNIVTHNHLNLRKLSCNVLTKSWHHFASIISSLIIRKAVETPSWVIQIIDKQDRTRKNSLRRDQITNLR